MATYKEKLSFQESADEVMALCTAAAGMMAEWKTVTQERYRLVLREIAVKDKAIQIPTQLEVKVLPLSSGCGLELSASNVSFGAAASQKAQANVKAFLKRYYFEVDRPNMERAEEEARLEREREKQRQREIQERADAAEMEQRAAARERALRQLLGKEPVEKAAPADGAEDETESVGGIPITEYVPPAETESSEPSLDELLLKKPRAEGPAPRRSGQPPIPAQWPSGQSGYRQPVAPAPPAAQVQEPPTSADDFVAKLERLANLHKAGALSDEEFAAAKRRLLDF